MKIKETHLKGCFVIEPKVFGDHRGNFFEVFNQKEFENKIGLQVNFVQDNQSKSQKGVLRGLHMQIGKFAQAKLVRVIRGKVLDVAVDFRKNSPTFGKYFSIELSGINNKQLFIPKGFLHGFVVLEDETIFAYKCDNFYAPYKEGGVRFDDKNLNIDWLLPKEELQISKKDNELPFFNEVIV